MVVVETIKRYLQEHRRLVVPSFGAFIVKQPGTVLFSELISADDGVLRQLLTEQGLSEIEAAAKIDRLIFEVRHSLINEGRCQISDFGHFTRTTDGNIRFYANHNAFIPKSEPQRTLPKSKSTSAIRPSQHKEHKVSATKEQPQPKRNTSSRKQSSFGGFAIWFAIVVIVAALAAIAYGIYCEMTIPDDIDAEMDAKRVEIIQESPNK